MTAFVAPRSLDEALGALGGAPKARVLAGGTDLMVELQTGRSRAERIVDLSRCVELRGIRHDAAGTFLGALTTCSDLLDDPQLAARVPLLGAVAREFAAPQIRNRATIGGNLATASPAGDLAPALLALGAAVRLRSRAGARDVPIAQFFTGYRRHAGRDDELIEGVLVPPRPAGERCAFEKVGTRAAQAIAKVSIAVTAIVAAGRVERIAAGAGAVADRTVALPSLGALRGEAPSPARIAAVAAAAAQHDVSPIDDVRSTARYRRHVVQRLLTAMLTGLLAED